MKLGSILGSIIFFFLLVILSGCNKDQADIEKWIEGTWELDKYEQHDFKDGELVDSNEMLNMGKVMFKSNGSGEDIGGEFIGGQFEWSNTDKNLTLVSGAGTTVYYIEVYSETAFIFSLTDSNGDDKFVERWYLSK